ncbi:MAG TPA: vWA domain-containing protein [Trichormus sp.]
MGNKRALGMMLLTAAMGLSTACPASVLADTPDTKSETKPTAKSESSKKERPKMDLAFCIDTTGSMQGEIDMVKTKVKEVVAKLASGSPAPEIRVGLVAYRDRGDQYVTKLFQFSDDIDKVVKDISGLKADGGGDAPESVNEGLHVAVHDLNWDTGKKTAKLLFLIGDAGPHYYANDYNWNDECKYAIGHGVQVNTIACGLLASNSEDLNVWQQIAKKTDGKYDTLAYRTEVTDASGHRATIVTAGDATYKVADDKGSWKDEVAKGKMMRMSSPARGYSALSKRAVSAAGAPSATAFAASPVVSDRRDNNLDSLLLDAAKAKAEKKLNVDYAH